MSYCIVYEYTLQTRKQKLPRNDTNFLSKQKSIHDQLTTSFSQREHKFREIFGFLTPRISNDTKSEPSVGPREPLFYFFPV